MTLIEVVWGTGEAETPLGAFDRALDGAGIRDYNLVRLSSVAPPDATVVEAGSATREFGVGEFVAVVLAREHTTTPGETAAAGLGWALAEEGGVFYEAGGDSAADCRRAVEAGTADLMGVRDWAWTGDPETRAVEHTLRDGDAGAAVVAAVFAPIPRGDPGRG